MNNLQFILKQIDMAFVDIVRIFVPDGPFVEDLSIRVGNLILKGMPFEMLQDALLELPYDYIIVAGSEKQIVNELRRIGIAKEKIINAQLLRMLPYFLEKYRLLREASKVDNVQACKIIVTGLSYAYHGTELNAYNLPTINFAGISQDIYYDYMMVKKILSAGGRPKYAVIGLAPYSFHSDLSIGGESWRVPAYGLILEDLHNYYMSWRDFFCVFRPGIESAKKEAIQYASFDFNDPIGLRVQLDYKMGSQQRILARERAESWKTKRYPATVRENVAILHSYVDLCLENNIKPIFVTFPVTDIYRKYFSSQIMKEFYKILAGFISDKVVFLDYFSSPLFGYDDFYDIDHLNRTGAKKISEMINEAIMEL